MARGMLTIIPVGKAKIVCSRLPSAWWTQGLASCPSDKTLSSSLSSSSLPKQKTFQVQTAQQCMHLQGRFSRD